MRVMEYSAVLLLGRVDLGELSHGAQDEDRLEEAAAYPPALFRGLWGYPLVTPPQENGYPRMVSVQRPQWVTRFLG